MKLSFVRITYGTEGIPIGIIMVVYPPNNLNSYLVLMKEEQNGIKN
ncbi:hypothetical protein H04402_00686 [Clostridium botulinum H04402 065]|nr:hypothetical protein H04402_00686 [Clostridium botulinum H04402 065]